MSNAALIPGPGSDVPLWGGFRIGHWFGIPIHIDYSWFPVAIFVIWIFATGTFGWYGAPGSYILGTLAALLFFLSVLLHEMGHALAGQLRGVEIQSISLFIFGGLARTRHAVQRPLDEFIITVAGPLSSFALAGVFLGAQLGVESLPIGPAWVLAELFSRLAFLNLILAIFNLIPGFPLDGGRILRSVVWAATGDIVKATRWATAGGRIFGIGLMGLGAWYLIWGDLMSGFWSVLIGLFIMRAATAALRDSERRHGTPIPTRPTV